MTDAAADPWALLIDLVFLAVTGAIAWHGIRYRDADGAPTFGHLLFGCIAAVFFVAVLLQQLGF
ncbi:MAG: hypothetical protein MUE49_04855 [Rhodospirillales bacterium]|jgi:hypothetical protein|nr:hypothetical protein [Rhodospirillales bacterium]